jgi:signal transduction histidine kinase/DNA-binding response OmpR family regulator
MSARFLVIFLLALFLFGKRVVAQSVTQADLQMLVRAEGCLTAFKNDSAMLLTGHLLETLKKCGQMDTPFGIRVQLAEAVALEQDAQGDLAISKLIRIIEQADKKNLPNLSAKAHLNLALIYEKIGSKDKSLEHLLNTKNRINQHTLDSVYPYFAIRMSSWQRIYGNRDTAIYFAQEALRTAPLLHLELEEAIGHMLMNMLLPQNALDERLKHSVKGVRLYEKIEDYTGCSYMYEAITSIYHEKELLYKALIYNDSAMMAAHRAIAKGHERHASIGNIYWFRGEMYKQLGQTDSAFYYFDKGHQTELNLMYEDNKSKIVEMDAQYNIEKQQQEIALKNNRIFYGLIVFALVSLLALGLFIGLRKQQQDKQQLTAQNTLIQEQSKQLKSLDAAKSRFFANVSHELRTPLTLLTSPIKTLLKENQLTQKQIQLLQMADRSGKQLSQLIDAILELRKLEMGKMTVMTEPTELRPWFQTYFDQFESLAVQKQIDYKVFLNMPEKAIVDLDREKCRQILFNLLSNAFKFTTAGGRIGAFVQVVEHQLQLSVTDTGPGIHPDDLPHLFDRYFQTNLPDKPVEGGTGIGLALCREYAQLFGGTITAESTLGKGAVFTIAFPIKMAQVEATDLVLPVSSNGSMAPAETAPVSPPSTSPSTSPSTAKPGILVVEDNPDLREYIRFVLQDKYEVVTAENGQEALSIMNGECNMMSGGGMHKKFNIQHSSPCIPDLVLSDLMMPVMDGYQLLERLKSGDATRHIPFVMLTARAEVQDKLKALRIGVDDYLTKPFDEEELLARIENLLKNQAARRAVIADDSPDPKVAVAPLMSQPDREWLETLEAYVQKHYSSDILSVTSLAYEFAMSESTLLRQLKRLTGLSPLQYIQEVRLNEARRLLETKALNSIAQVASKVGYDDARTFTRSFKQRFGKLPSEVMEA